MRSPSYRPERAVVALTGHTLREPRWSSHARTVFLDIKLLESSFMRITEAARRLGTSARMLRYREELGLLPQVRDQFGRPGVLPDRPHGPSHRQFGEADLEAVAAALELE